MFQIIHIHFFKSRSPFKKVSQQWYLHWNRERYLVLQPVLKLAVLVY